jgi:hypothetical protein
VIETPPDVMVGPVASVSSVVGVVAGGASVVVVVDGVVVVVTSAPVVVGAAVVSTLGVLAAVSVSPDPQAANTAAMASVVAPKRHRI